MLRVSEPDELEHTSKSVIFPVVKIANLQNLLMTITTTLTQFSPDLPSSLEAQNSVVEHPKILQNKSGHNVMSTFFLLFSDGLHQF